MQGTRDARSNLYQRMERASVRLGKDISHTLSFQKVLGRL